MKKAVFGIAIVVLLVVLYLGAAVFVKPYGPDIIIHNKGKSELSFTIYVPGANSKAKIASGKTIHLQDLVKSEGSIKIEIDGKKTELYGYCGNYSDGIIEVEINGEKVKIVRQKVSSNIFNWDLR